jgi:hypothetical protein
LVTAPLPNPRIQRATITVPDLEKVCSLCSYKENWQLFAKFIGWENSPFEAEVRFASLRVELPE